MKKPDFIFENKSLKTYTTWRVGGNAEFFCAPTNLRELEDSYLWAKLSGHPVSVLGDGSNTLISDDGVSGVVVVLKKLRGFDFKETRSTLEVEALAGTPKSELFQLCLKYKLPSAIFLSGLPGTISGGVTMNAGVGGDTVPREFCDIVESFDVLFFDEDKQKLTAQTFYSNDVRWSYRECSGWKGVITKVKFSFPLADSSPEVPNLVIEAQAKRKKTQPIHRSCGCVFKNPSKEWTAGSLIESCHLKSHRVGGAEVSPLHANFIITDKAAQAQDIYYLIKKVRQEVKKQFDIDLQTEVKLLGEFTL